MLPVTAALATALLLPSGGSPGLTRRAALCGAGASCAAALLVPQVALAGALIDPPKVNGKNGALPDVNLEELPPGAAQAYRQYWPAMQLAGDLYVFEVRDLVAQPQRWDLVGAMMESKSIGSAQSPSRIEREFLTPMRIIALAFPPDLGGDEMQAALDQFQRAMGKLSRAARSSPGGLATPDASEVNAALGHWDAGRVAMNDFYAAMNAATSSTRMVGIPAKGAGYPRSKQLYVQLMKDAAQCRNRGGEALAGLWGQLMVYGTVPGVNPCGSVNMQTYFAQ